MEDTLHTPWPNWKILEIGPLRFGKGELKVTITRPFQVTFCKGELYSAVNVL